MSCRFIGYVDIESVFKISIVCGLTDDELMRIPQLLTLALIKCR